MTRFLTILLIAFTLNGFAQTYPVRTTITLPTNPDPNTAFWSTGTSLLVITATAQGATGGKAPSVDGSKILVVIRKGSTKVCGSYTSTSAPSANFTSFVKVWSGNDAVSLLGQNCTLTPGDYELSVQLFGPGAAVAIPISEEKTKAFTIKETTQQTYQAPRLIAPASNTEYSETDIQKPIILRWLPVIPVPKDPVTYRLNIWQLMVGKTATQVRASNAPILTRDITNLTQTTITNLITGPCKPPYLCDFTWTVQALNRDGKPIGQDNGTSEPFNFKVAEAACGNITSTSTIECGKPDPKTGLPTYIVSVKITNDAPAASKGCDLVVNSITSVSSGTVLPPGTSLPVTITSNTTATISFTYFPASTTGATATFSLNGAWSGGAGDATKVPLRMDLPKCAPTVRLGSICGMKFNDLNGNGVQDSNEPGIQGWQITLAGTDQVVKTDDKGNYCFNNLKPGEYTIKEEMRPGWIQTTPTDGSFTIKLNAGQSISGQNFGNKLDPCATKVWSALGTGVNGTVYAMALMGTDLYVGGQFTIAGGVPVNNIAKWNGTSWSAVGSGVNHAIRALAVSGTTLYAGGDFTTAGGVSANYIAKWDGANWAAVGSGTNAVVRALKVSGANLYAGGDFTIVGGISTLNIAKWNGASWAAVGNGLPSITVGTKVNAIEEAGGRLYVGGYFSFTALGYGTNNVAQWDGTNWSGLAVNTLNGPVNTLAVAGSDVYLGGWSTLPVGANRIVKWNGTAYSLLSTGVDGNTTNILVYALATAGTDLYVGGQFTTAGGLNASHIAKWNGTNWSALGAGTNGDVVAITASGQDIYIGGVFTSADGLSVSNIVKYGCNLPPPVVVNTLTGCDCKGKTWDVTQKVNYNDGIKAIGQEVDCSGKLNSKVQPGSIIQYNAPAYVCSSAKCSAVYQWKIVNVQSGAVISRGTAPGLPVNFTAPTATGDYQLIISPVCDTKTCASCGFFFSIDTPVVQGCIAPPPGMVGWWPGDNNANDISGNNNGTLQGGASYLTGKVANGFKLSTNSDYISIPDNSSLNFGINNFSIDAWIKTKDNLTDICIVNKLIINGTSLVGYSLFLKQGKLAFEMGEGYRKPNQLKKQAIMAMPVKYIDRLPIIFKKPLPPSSGNTSMRFLMKKS